MVHFVCTMYLLNYAKRNLTYSVCVNYTKLKKYLDIRQEKV